MIFRKSYVDIFAARRSGVLNAKTSIGERASKQSAAPTPGTFYIMNGQQIGAIQKRYDT